MRSLKKNISPVLLVGGGYISLDEDKRMFGKPALTKPATEFVLELELDFLSNQPLISPEEDNELIYVLLCGTTAVGKSCSTFQTKRKVPQTPAVPPLLLSGF